MKATLKTIAEFMGWELFLNDPDSDDHYCTEEFKHESGAVTVHYYRPHACRDDLQLVLEKFTPEQLHVLDVQMRWHCMTNRVPRQTTLIAALLLPTETLADIAAQVIGETP